MGAGLDRTCAYSLHKARSLPPRRRAHTSLTSTFPCFAEGDAADLVEAVQGRVRQDGRGQERQTLVRSLRTPHARAVASRPRPPTPARRDEFHKALNGNAKVGGAAARREVTLEQVARFLSFENSPGR
jgi:hypothetical protein